jgi:tRNA pseudouridine32 synthase/23S rRNA pseudouridine746 synthase/23S rRNA pseudouridine1911/1915/1917 synthase
LDRDVSGVLLFAKTHDVKEFLQEHWGGTKKKYQAVVHGTMEDRTGILTSYLAENNSFTVYATSDTRKGKLSYTEYQVLKEANGVSLLEINLLTGRKHQIRVQLADEGHPVVGDKKYGPKDKLSKRLALHATSITFNHPHSGIQMTIESPIPSLFHRLLTGQSCV